MEEQKYSDNDVIELVGTQAIWSIYKACAYFSLLISRCRTYFYAKG